MIKISLNDLEVLIKSTVGNRSGPYRRIDPGILGAIPELKLKTGRSGEKVEEDPNAFTTVERSRRKKHGKHVSKKRVFDRLDRFLERQEAVSDEEISAEDML